MEKMNAFKSELTSQFRVFTRWHILPVFIAMGFLFTPINTPIVGFWNFTWTFVHEMGHGYFGLLAGDSLLYIDNNPLEAWVMKPDKLEFIILVSLGGIIFTIIFGIILIGTTLFLLKRDGITDKKQVLFAQSIGGDFIAIISSKILLEVLANGIPFESNEYGTNDMGKLLGEYLKTPFVLSSETQPLMFLIYFVLIMILFLVQNLFYILFISSCIFLMALKVKSWVVDTDEGL